MLPSAKRLKQSTKSGAKQILGVEMEAAALYAFARSAGVRLLFLAHVTNTMGQAVKISRRAKPTEPGMSLSVLGSIIEALRPAN